jgi:hypothetical protein
MNTLQRRRLAAMALIGSLTGCGTPLPKYVEPDAKLTKVARLRIVVLPGISPGVLVYPDNQNECVSREGATKFPVHTNTSGFAGESTTKIGMPFGTTFNGKWGSEFYIPAGTPMTIGATYSGGSERLSVSCQRAFRFRPEVGRDYQLFFFAGAVSMTQGACQFELGEIKEGRSDSRGNAIVTSVPFTPVWTEGSREWKERCVSAVK